MPDADDPKQAQGSPQGGNLAPADEEEVVDGEITPDAQPGRGRLIAASEFSGPLPPPKALGEYDQVSPGLAETIVEQWKLETAHRHKTIDGVRQTDHESMKKYYSGQRWGQVVALLAFLALMGVAVLAILEDSDLGTLASLIVAGSYAIWALRRDPGASSPTPTDLGDGDEVEALPDESRGEAEQG